MALAFLDEVRAKDYSIYHRLPHTQVVVVAAAYSPAVPAETPPLMTGAKSAAEPVKSTAESTSRAEKQTERKKSTGKSDAPTLPARPISEGAKGERGRKASPRKARSSKTPTPMPPESLTVVEVKIDVGLGNTLFIRGQGGGLSWDKGQPLKCLDSTTWVWSTSQTSDRLVFKLLLNDQVWAKGKDTVLEAGKKIQMVPAF